MEAITQFDVNILNWIQQNLVCPFLDAAMPCFSFMLEAGWFFILIAVIMLIFPKSRRTGATLGLALLIGVITCSVFLKPMVFRPRPCWEEIAIKYGALKWGVPGTDGSLLITVPKDGSWPSGHTAAAFEGAIVLMTYKKRYGIPALVFAVIVAFSRMYEYVHYPTDIIGGLLVAAVSSTISYFLVKFVWNKVAAKYAEKHPKAE